MIDLNGKADLFYIGGHWIQPNGRQRRPVINPATQAVFASVPMASKEDVNHAVASARAAFDMFSRSTLDERCALIERFDKAFARHRAHMAHLLVEELGAPIDLAINAHCAVVEAHVADFLHAARSRAFEKAFGTHAQTIREPMGVCALITPWNWPPNQIALKVLAALAAGCTMVLKPSEVTPLNAVLFAQIMDEAGVPPGVFNMIQGDGQGAGTWLSQHPDIDIVSFTGSTEAGKAIYANAANTMKRLSLELGKRCFAPTFCDRA
ncbi:MAG: aldehyde dehydrogenase family protein [Phyllobacteriaceae bacterium]|nr:aldehyde dehydrogenase family protein [Phyllobacteriaceae bacterium]